MAARGIASHSKSYRIALVFRSHVRIRCDQRLARFNVSVTGGIVKRPASPWKNRISGANCRQAEVGTILKISRVDVSFFRQHQGTRFNAAITSRHVQGRAFADRTGSQERISERCETFERET